jgi:opacity protein-like surface antigen
MNHTKWTSIVALASACTLAMPAVAATPGFYLSAAAGTTGEDPRSNGTNFANSQGIVHVDPVSVQVDDGGTGWGVGLGYRVNDYLAGELEYEEFGTTHVTEHYSVPNLSPIPFPTTLDLSYSSQVTGPVLSVLGTLPVGHGFELFVRAGALFASREFRVGGTIVFNPRDQKFADTVWVAGAGASWSFAERWALRAEYQQTDTLQKTLATGTTRVTRASLSAIYRF